MGDTQGISGGWRKVKSPLEPGYHLFQGNEACAEGAIAAGCNYFAGYPITPATEVMERICARFAELPGRVFMQMEDELASLSSVIGAAWAGAKAMTATSGPGLSLMVENIGYAISTETPCVVVDVQRAGPTTGQPTRPTQSDVMQVRYGAHGDYETIVLSPWSVAEMYWETIRAFNLAERFRTLVFVLADEAVGHLVEAVQIPEEIEIFERRRGKGEPPFLGQDIPLMPLFGDGAKLMVTGSAHDEWGYREVTNYEVQARSIRHLADKILSHLDEILQVEVSHGEEKELEVLVVAYGITARSALAAVHLARERGMRVGLCRLKTLWPFPEKVLRLEVEKAQRVLVPELNLGKMVREVQRLRPEAEPLTKIDGHIFTPEEILRAITGEAR